MDKLKLFKSNIKFNKKGNIYKYIEISKFFKKISEVYFSKVKKNNIKAWKKNKTSNQYFYVFVGKINLKIFDDRNRKNKMYNFILGSKSKYSKIQKPSICSSQQRLVSKDIQYHQLSINGFLDLVVT